MNACRRPCATCQLKWASARPHAQVQSRRRRGSWLLAQNVVLESPCYRCASSRPLSTRQLCVCVLLAPTAQALLMAACPMQVLNTCSALADGRDGRAAILAEIDLYLKLSGRACQGATLVHHLKTLRRGNRTERPTAQTTHPGLWLVPRASRGVALGQSSNGRKCYLKLHARVVTQCVSRRTTAAAPQSSQSSGPGCSRS